MEIILNNLVCIFVFIKIISVILTVISILRYFKKLSIDKYLIIIYILLAIMMGIVGLELIWNYSSSPRRYDIGLILIDNFVGSVVFAFIVAVLKSLIKNKKTEKEKTEFLRVMLIGHCQ